MSLYILKRNKYREKLESTEGLLKLTSDELFDVLREFYSTKEVARMIQEQTIEISPLAFMRGRTFKNAWIIADEMQNATPSQMKMLMTRIGEKIGRAHV